FVSLPALIAVGVPSVQANASSTVALYPGGVASVWAYRQSLSPVGNVRLVHLLYITLAGGACGALLLLGTPTKAFDVLLPWLLLIATIALAFGNKIGEALRRRCRVHPNFVLAIQFLLGVYGGYFGGGVGLMMLAMWGLLERRDLKSLNASRTLLVVAANTMAVLIFIVARAVFWREVIGMLLAATLGGYGGAQLGRRCPPAVLRGLTLSITVSITIAFFVRAYGLSALR
ncbi:MAG TPA: sulfite exporter TauE/SafE family protein, partial [Lacipirellulaceae bacterium]|nr:sulfite exporter TauE/SafE family protein [Lacipirellulaceae bacterium]